MKPITVNLNINIRCRRKKQKPALILWTFGPVQEQRLPGPSKDIHMTQLTDSQFVTGTVKPLNKKKNPAPVEPGTVKFVSSDPAVLIAEPDPADPTNELAVKVTAVASGAARLTCSFDADLGQGVQLVELFEDFSVTGGPAVGGSMTFGTPQEQP